VARSGLRDINAYLTPRARHDLAAAIAEADGNEVFFVGRPASVGRIDEVEVFCRGHKTAVPALRQVGRPGEVVIHNHPSGHLTPSDPDITLASHYGQEGVGFMIVNNEVDGVYVVVEPLRDTHRPVEEEEVSQFLAGPEGLPSFLDGYEPRGGQLEMANAVRRAQNEDRVTVIEAGTGTGKSLAYLVPSALRALQNEERVAVSTRTRHLQGQLMNKDVPLLRKLKPELDVAILKGRGNYLCRRKLGDRLASLGKGGEDEADEVEFLRDISAWVATTAEGDRDDLPFVPDFRLWEGVASNSEHTRRARCPHFEECFYYNSRRKAAGAHLLLVNHHLLLADRSLRMEGAGGLLPRYEHVVLDEAHHLEDVATEFAGRSVSGRGILQQLGRIRPTRGRRKGLALRLRLATESAGGDDAAVNLLLAIDRMTDDVEAVRITLKLHLQDVSEAIIESAEEERSERRGYSVRLDDQLAAKDPVLLSLVEEKVAELRKLLANLGGKIEKVLDAHQDMPPLFSQRTLQLSLDLRTVRNRVIDAAAGLGQVLESDPESVRWVDLTRDGQGQMHPRFHVRPVTVDDVLDDTLFSGLRSVTLTSATLSVAGRFDHFQSRTGVGKGPGSEDRFESLQIGSPFDYPKQVMLGIPEDLPEPGQNGHMEGLVDAITRAVLLVDGRTFALFTSYRTLRQAAAGVASRLGAEFTILKQGDLPRERLLQLFREGRKTVLFGTDSFWEGVDVRGEALSSVIITRLPFRVPSEPIQLARAERISAGGGDPFAEMSVPQAVLRFRQGFGRLIRHREDRGIVFVLDGRITKRRYGKRFTQSLPEGVVPRVGPLESILREMERFLSGPTE
jgi:ATP-dependent DNA helicase DinG